MPTVSAPPGAPLLPLAAARQLLADLTHGAPLPAAPDVLDKYAFTRSGAVIVGDVALHGHKVRGKWTVREDAVRDAAASLARPLDLRDLVPLPSPRSSSPPWQQELKWAVEAVTAYGESRAPFFDTSEDRERICDVWEVQGVRALSVVVWADGWRIPRGLRELFNRGARVRRALAAAVRPCAGCGADGGPDPFRLGWRRPTDAGWLTLCPPCAVAGAVAYEGEHAARKYETVKGRRREGHPDAVPGRYRCALCPVRATLWDHCHAHGWVRGPLCGRCNQEEARWLGSAAGRSHLWSCGQCREERTLPVRQLVHLVQRAPVPFRHDGCSTEPVLSSAPAASDDGAPTVRLHLYCAPHTHHWHADVPHADLLAAAREHMTQAGKTG